MDAETRALRTRETRARRKAERQGLRLEKSRRRDPDALDYGHYHLVDPEHRMVYSGATLDQIEDYLKGGRS